MTQLENQPASQPPPLPPTPPPPPQIGDLVNPFNRLQPNSPMTYGLLAIIIVIFILMISNATIAGIDIGTLISFYGPTNGPRMIEDNELWRLFTSMFLHANQVHILFNSIVLYSLGREIERVYGSGRFLIIYILSGLAGGLLSFALRGYDESSVGASGAIFGIAGVNLAFYYFYRDRLGQFGQAQYQSMLRFVGINLAIGFLLIRVNNWAHFGGLVGGIILGYLFMPKYIITETIPTIELNDEGSLGNRWWMALLAFAMLLALSFFVRQFYA